MQNTKIEISFELAIRLLGVIEMFKEKMPHGWHEAIASELSASIIDAGREECEHDFDPDSGNHCLHCDKDGTEDVMSAEYDRAKDVRKYGE